MRIEYVCRHCQQRVGEINRPDWSIRDVARLCGIPDMASVEHSDTIAYNQKQSVAYVHVVCDYCQEAVEDNPELLLEGKLLQ